MARFCSLNEILNWIGTTKRKIIKLSHKKYFGSCAFGVVCSCCAFSLCQVMYQWLLVSDVWRGVNCCGDTCLCVCVCFLYTCMQLAAMSDNKRVKKRQREVLFFFHCKLYVAADRTDMLVKLSFVM